MDHSKRMGEARLVHADVLRRKSISSGLLAQRQSKWKAPTARTRLRRAQLRRAQNCGGRNCDGRNYGGRV
eukprot:3502767-Pleurochrysis_carterae.AAC.3